MKTTKTHKSPIEITHAVTFRKVQELFDGKPGADLTMTQIQRALGARSLRGKKEILYYEDRALYNEIVEENRKIKKAVDYLIRRGWLAVTYGSICANNSADRYHVKTKVEREADRVHRREEELAIKVAKALGGGNKLDHNDEEERGRVLRSGAVASCGDLKITGEALKKLAKILEENGML